MKTECNGRYFDTGVAKLIGSGGDSEYHEGGWHLYQMPSCEFFKVLYGYEGEEIGFTAMWYQDGLALQHQVEERKGPEWCPLGLVAPHHLLDENR